MSEAVQELVVETRTIGLRRGTVKRAEFHPRAFFQLDGRVDGVNMPYVETGGMLEDLQPRTCEQLYATMVKEQRMPVQPPPRTATEPTGSAIVAVTG